MYLCVGFVSQSKYKYFIAIMLPKHEHTAILSSQYSGHFPSKCKTTLLQVVTQVVSSCNRAVLHLLGKLIDNYKG